MRLGDVGEPDGLIIRFGRRCEKRAEPNVIGAFGGSRPSLFEAVGRFPDKEIFPALCPRLLNRKIVLAHMNSIGAHRSRDRWVIVDDQRHISFGREPSEIRRDRFDLMRLQLLGSQLQDIDAAGHHLPGDTQHIRGSDVAKIENAVKTAAGERMQNYWSNRCGGALSSNFPESIRRWMNPVSKLPARNSALRIMAA